MKNSFITVLVLIGTKGRDLLRLRRKADRAVAIDTEEAVKSVDAPNVQAIHLGIDPTRNACPEIPDRSVAGAGRDGAALFSPAALRAFEVVRAAVAEILERVVQGASKVVLAASSGGGTGTALRMPILEDLSKVCGDARIFDVNVINPTVNPVKQACRIRDFGRGTPGDVVTVIVGDEDHVEDVVAATDEECAAVAGIARNMLAAHSETPFCVYQWRRQVINESAIVDGVIDGLVQRHIAQRWQRGRKAGSVPQREVRTNDVREMVAQLPDLAQSNGLDRDHLIRAARSGTHALRHATRTVIEARSAVVQEAIARVVRAIREELPVVGLDAIEDELSGMREALSGRAAELEAELSTTDREKIVATAVEGVRGFRAWVTRAVGARNAGIVDDVIRYIACEEEFEATQILAHELKGLVRPPMSALAVTEPFWLPEGSELADHLVDVFFGAHEGEAVRALRRAIAERMPDVIVAALGPILPTELRFDFAMSHEVMRSTGLVIGSRFGNAIRGLAEAVHVHPKHVAHVLVDEHHVVVLHFAIVRRLLDLPSLADLVRRVDDLSATMEDRRLFARYAPDIWPVPLREAAEVAPERGALVLAMSAVVPSAVRVTGSKVSVFATEGSTWDSFDDLLSQLSIEAEQELCNRFWAYFAAGRVRCASQIAGLLEHGGADTGDSAQRAARLRSFVGAKRWDMAVELLAKQVRIAGGYWK